MSDGIPDNVKIANLEGRLAEAEAKLADREAAAKALDMERATLIRNNRELQQRLVEMAGLSAPLSRLINEAHRHASSVFKT